VKFAFVAAEKARFPVSTMCRYLCVSTSGFYAWSNRGKSARRVEDERLARAVAHVHTASRRRYGSPRVMHQLRREGTRVGRKRVARLMREQGLVARRRRRVARTTDSRHGEPIAPNLVARNFTAAMPGRVMVGDTTAVETREGWLFLAVLVDLCTRAIVGWSMSETNDTALVSQAFRAAVRRGFRRGFIHHTDRGSTYASKDYCKLVEGAGGVRSMSRRADCYDNAVAESVFRTIKEEGIGHAVPQTHSEARERIFSFIEGFYNSTRLHSSLGYRTPLEVEREKFKELSKNRKRTL
jgi:transposase InsO family protein